MTIFKKRILIVLLLCIPIALSSSILKAGVNDPYLKIVRTDVDSVRDGFITACYTFGFDVIAENTERCSGVSFDLLYNQSDVIKFSGSATRDLMKAFVDSRPEPGAANHSRVIVGALSGDQSSDSGRTSPNAIHLEFVVMASALDYSNSQTFAEFTFRSPEATIITDSGSVTISLPVKVERYKIHSFIDVHPGDTDNNGIVNSDDYQLVERHYGTGSLTDNFRSFKRANPSTMWFPQPALRWDSAMVTYSDCDGNGDITLADGLIVQANLDQTHSSASSFLPIVSSIESKERYLSKPIAESGDIRIPIMINSDDKMIGLTGSANIDGFEGKIKGIEYGEFFGGEPIIISKTLRQGKSVEFLIVNNTEQKIEETNGIAGYIVIESSSSKLPEINFSNIKAVNNAGDIFIIHKENITAIEDDDFNLSSIDYISSFNNELKIENVSNRANFRLVDLAGRTVIRKNICHSESIDMSGLQRGLYIAIIQDKTRIIRKKIIHSN